MDGWVKVHRKIMDSSIYQDSELVHLWVHLLMSVCIKEMEYDLNGKQITLRAGQLVTGRKKLSRETAIHESKIQRALKKFETCHMIEQQKSNKNRIITIVNWDKYQSGEQLSNSYRTTNEQQMNTKEEGKKERSTYVEDSTEFRLAVFLLKHIRKNKPDFKEPNLQSWAKDADLMLRKDKRNIETAKRLIQWSQDDDFEKSNVLSMGKLRKRFDNLEMKMKKGNNQDSTPMVM